MLMKHADWVSEVQLHLFTHLDDPVDMDDGYDWDQHYRDSHAPWVAVQFYIERTVNEVPV